MVTIGMNYHVLAGKEDVFEAAFGRVREALQQAKGHAESRLYRGLEIDPNVDYLIVSRWEHEEAFQDFIQSDAFRKVTNWGLENILAGRPSHTTYLEKD